MTRKKLTYFVPVNVLISDNGVKEMLVAIAYYRGEAGNYAGPVRDALESWTREFRSALPPTERRRFDNILATVKTTQALKKAISSDSPSAESPRLD